MATDGLSKVTGVPEAGASRRNLLVACAQWLATPGDPDRNLATAAQLIGEAADAGADIVVLPELWACGYEASTLTGGAAEPASGPRATALSELARRHGLWLFAGTVPEQADGQIYGTALAFNREGALVARHRKAHLYPRTGEHAIFAAGDCLTSFLDRELGNVGVLVCFDGDFPQSALTLAACGADLVILPSAYEWEARAYWDLLYPAAALANGQWWVMVNQCGSTATGRLLGGSKVISPAGRVIAQARRAEPGDVPEPELLLCRLDNSEDDAEALALAAEMRACARPELYDGAS
jgi:predicted amidohydrolase